MTFCCLAAPLLPVDFGTTQENTQKELCLKLSMGICFASGHVFANVPACQENCHLHAACSFASLPNFLKHPQETLDFQLTTIRNMRENGEARRKEHEQCERLTAACYTIARKQLRETKLWTKSTAISDHEDYSGATLLEEHWPEKTVLHSGFALYQATHSWPMLHISCVNQRSPIKVAASSRSSRERSKARSIRTQPAISCYCKP